MKYFFVVLDIHKLGIKCLLFILLLFHLSTSSGQILINGGVISGAISIPDEEDAYTFSGQAGDGVVIRLADTRDSLLYPGLILYGPDGQLLAINASSSVAHIQSLLPESGTYTTYV